MGFRDCDDSFDLVVWTVIQHVEKSTRPSHMTIRSVCAASPYHQGKPRYVPYSVTLCLIQLWLARQRVTRARQNERPARRNETRTRQNETLPSASSGQAPSANSGQVLRRTQGRFFDGRTGPFRGHSHREGGFQTRPYAARMIRRQGPRGAGPCRQRSRHVVSSVFGGVHKGRLYKRG